MPEILLLIYYYFSYFIGVMEGVWGGACGGYFSPQGFSYINTSHRKYDFISERTRPLYMSKNI